MGFFEKLPKHFITSAVRQVGRDGGKVISNKIYKGKHGTPIYNSGNSSRSIVGNQQQQVDRSSIDMRIQPPVKGGGLGVIIKGVLIQVVPFGLIAVLIKGILYLNKSSVKVYSRVANHVPDKRFKEGYRVDGYSIVKTDFERTLQDFEMRRMRSRGVSYLLSVVVFFFIGGIIYFNSDIANSTNTELQATNYWYIDGGQGVNVRNEPTTQGEVLFTLNSTDSVLVIDKNGPAETVSGRSLNWYRIKHNDLEGWVWSGLLKERQ
jgi:hypothetical protein